MSRVLATVAAAGITLPPPNTARPARLRRTSRVGGTVYLSGTGPWHGGTLLFRGKLGQDLSVEAGYEAARATALNQMRILLDEGYDLDDIRWVKVNGFINCDPAFTQPSEVLNGFTDTVIQFFGEDRGLASRTACGVAAIPWNMPLEVEAVCCVEGAAR